MQMLFDEPNITVKKPWQACSSFFAGAGGLYIGAGASNGGIQGRKDALRQIVWISCLGRRETVFILMLILKSQG